MIYHTAQRETSHSPFRAARANYLRMDASETFRRTLIRIRKERKMGATALSVAAGLGERAVKDIEEGRSASPKLSTVFKIAEALDVDPGEMIGLGPRPRLSKRLVEYLQQYDEADQERLLEALASLPRTPA